MGRGDVPALPDRWPTLAVPVAALLRFAMPHASAATRSKLPWPAYDRSIVTRVHCSRIHECRPADPTAAVLGRRRREQPVPLQRPLPRRVDPGAVPAMRARSATGGFSRCRRRAEVFVGDGLRASSWCSSPWPSSSPWSSAPPDCTASSYGLRLIRPRGSPRSSHPDVQPACDACEARNRTRSASGPARDQLAHRPGDPLAPFGLVARPSLLSVGRSRRVRRRE